MGLAGKLSEMRMKDPVEGTATVAAVDFPHGRTYNDGRPYTRLECVASGPGIEPVAFEHKSMIVAGKVPMRGDVLPVLIDRANPKRVVIDWDKVASRDLGWSDQRRDDRQQAEKLAAEMRDRVGGAPASSPAGQDAQRHTDSATIHANAEAAQARRAQRIAQSKADHAQEATGRGGEEQKLSQLERLARLHADGALTDAEFAAEKTKLLSS